MIVQEMPKKISNKKYNTHSYSWISSKGSNTTVKIVLSFLFCFQGLERWNVPMQIGQTVMVIIEKQNSLKSNITGGGKQIEFLVNYKLHKITMVNIRFIY